MSRKQDKPYEPDWDEDDGYALGVMAALEGMDLPDGAYCAMAEELGVDIIPPEPKRKRRRRK